MGFCLHYNILQTFIMISRAKILTFHMGFLLPWPAYNASKTMIISPNHISIVEISIQRFYLLGMRYSPWTTDFQYNFLDIMWTKGNIPDSKVHGTNMGPTWVLPAPDGPHVGPMNLAIWNRAALEPSVDTPCVALTLWSVRSLLVLTEVQQCV